MIFERQDRSGGKVMTYRDGDRLWNLSTCYTTLGYRTVNPLQKRYGVTQLELAEASIVSEAGSTTDFVTYIRGDGGRIALIWQGTRYVAHWFWLFLRTGFSYNAATSHPQLACPSN